MATNCTKESVLSDPCQAIADGFLSGSNYSQYGLSFGEYLQIVASCKCCEKTLASLAPEPPVYLSEEIISYDDLQDYTLTPPTDATVAEIQFRDNDGILATIEYAYGRSPVAPIGQLANGHLEIEGNDEINKFTFRGLPGESGQAIVFYKKQIPNDND